MSERLQHHLERSELESFQLGEIVQVLKSFFATLLLHKLADDADIAWEDGEIGEDRRARH